MPFSFADCLTTIGGDTGRLIASRDWSATSLRAIEAWPQSLRTALTTLLASPVPLVMLWGEPGVMLYNDAYSVFAGGRHPELLGREVREGWPEVADFNDHVMQVGLAGGTLAYKDQELTLYRHGRPEQVFMNLDYSPVFDEAGRPAGVLAVVVETTARVLADRRQSFRLELERALRDLEDPVAMMNEATAALGRQLGAAQVGFGEVDDAQSHVAVHGDWNDGRIPSVVGTWRMDDFGPAFIATMKAGHTAAIEDVRDDPRTSSPAVVAAYDHIAARAILDVPLIRGGKMAAMLFIHDPHPRDWTAEEIGLAEETSARLWSAVDRARAEAALRASEGRLRELNETLERRVAEASADLDRVWSNASDIFMVLDTHGVLRRANPAASAILGWTEAELVGRPILELIHPDDLPSSKAALEHVRANHPPILENRYRTKDGGLRTISWLAAPEGELIYAYGRDVTADKQRQAELEVAQEALRQSQKMEAMGQLTGGVAHDFNNLLTPIVGSLDMLQRKGVGGEREQRLIAGAIQAAERARTLVQRLLAFARRQPLQSVAVDLAKLVTGMGDLVSSTTGPQIKVVVEAGDDLPPAQADPNQLEMALLNLAVNARDAMPEGGLLRISASTETVGPGHRSRLKPDTYVRLSVADTGTGMDEATVARAVEPFFSTKGIGKGTGLGLSMVHGLASQLGGALTIQSRPGLGTNVELWLRRSASAPDPVVPEAERASAAPTRRTVLLVDDDELVRMNTADMLHDLGYAVIEAGSGEAAMRLIRGSDHIDLLVTDHLMPGITGSDLARAIRGARPSLPVLLVSGYAEREGIAPDLPRLAKPFRLDELASSLAQLGGGAPSSMP